MREHNPGYAARQRQNTLDWLARHPGYRWNPEKQREKNRKRTERNRLALQTQLQRQHGRCGLCGVKDAKRWHYDHCHTSGKLRKVLCSKCNNGLGFFNDSPAELRRAADYLDAHDA